MWLLMAEPFGFYDALAQFGSPTGFWGRALEQFQHHPWRGLHFWDLVQPFFMFIAGVALALSQRPRPVEVVIPTRAWRRIIRRCALLFVFGLLLQCFGSRRFVWELWNVLSHLSLSLALGYFLLRYTIRVQVWASLAPIALSDLCYRAFQLRDSFSSQRNFGQVVDRLLMRKTNPEGWVAFSAVATSAHTIWGSVCGQLLQREATGLTVSPTERRSPMLRALFGWGALALLGGVLLDTLALSPLVKRLGSASFVLVGGGSAIIALVALHLWIDRPSPPGRWTAPVLAVGRNSLLVYLLSQTLGPLFVAVVRRVLIASSLVGPRAALFVAATLGIVAMWQLCAWLDRRNIIVRV